jgi:hypothetical protein
MLAGNSSVVAMELYMYMHIYTPCVEIFTFVYMHANGMANVIMVWRELRGSDLLQRPVDQMTRSGKRLGQTAWLETNPAKQDRFDMV